mgnify:CR=1 FL=1
MTLVILRTKGKFRRIKNKYIGKKLFISPRIDINKFINDINNDNIIYITDDLPQNVAIDLLTKEHPDKIIISSNINLLRKGMSDYNIVLSNPDPEKKDLLFENQVIYDRILSSKDEDFISKLEFIKEGDNLLDF